MSLGPSRAIFSLGAKSYAIYSYDTVSVAQLLHFVS
jgi:hypothetical protein